MDQTIRMFFSRENEMAGGKRPDVQHIVRVSTHEVAPTEGEMIVLA